MNNKKLRKIAKQINQIHYIPDEPCKNGHLSKRNTKKDLCLQCDSESSTYRASNKLLRELAKQQDKLTYESFRPCKNGHVGSRFTFNKRCVICHNIKREKMNNVLPTQYYVVDNGINDKFYVYGLWDKHKNKLFYIGKTNTPNDRLVDHLTEAKNSISNTTANFKARKICKILIDGGDIELRLLYGFGNEQDAHKKEIELIKFYGRRNNKTGILTNLTDGGEGLIGIIWSKESREKQSKNMQGENHYGYGEKRPDCIKKKISETVKRKFKTGEMHAPILTPEQRKQRTINAANGHKIPILAIDKNGIVCHKFASAIDAAIILTTHKNSAMHINKCCHTTKNTLAYGFYWRYESEYDSTENFLKLTYDKNLKPVYQIHPETKEIVKEWYNNIKEISNIINVHYATIYNAIRKKKKAAGFLWKFKTFEEIIPSS